jgi:DNA ligase (NAD+)
MSPEERLSRLRDELNFHLYRYHVLDAPVISDAEYDSLFQELLALERRYPQLITADSPSQRSGAEPLDNFAKVEHPAPILSLASGTSSDDLKAWRTRIGRLLPANAELDYVVEPKIDGLTVVLTYRNGRFIQGATRGNGQIGEEISRNLMTLFALPKRIPVDLRSKLTPPPYLVVRGEAFFPLDKFEQFNADRLSAGEAAYMNPRNAASGSLRQLDPTITAARPLTLYCYDLVAWAGFEPPATQWERLAYLRQLGFPVAEDIAHCASLEEVAALYHSWIEKRNQINYEVDGVVVKINERPLADSLGFVGKDPRGAIALKFPAREMTTRLLEVQVNVGRTGVLAPNAVLEPVEIGGVMVKNATLHNYDEIARKDIRIGDTVLVKRAGDVIPYVVGPVVELRTGEEIPILPPRRCPFCNERVVRLPGEVAIYCDNAACPEQLVRRVEYFVSRPAMDISSFGSQTAVLLMEKGLIQDVGDIYYLNRDDLLALEGFQEKKVDNLLAGIEDSKRQPPDRLLTAVGIRYVGNVVARLLLDALGSIEALGQAGQQELQAIEGIGPQTAAAVAAWFRDSHNLELLQKLKQAGLRFEQRKEAVTSRALADLTFVITGTLPTMSREQAKALIEQHGGKVTGSVSKATDYLLAGEKAGSKLDKAAQIGISIIDEARLHEMING